MELSEQVSDQIIQRSGHASFVIGPDKQFNIENFPRWL